jgi:hypothetical protein
LQVKPSQCQRFIDIARKIEAQYAGYTYQDRDDVYGVYFFEDQNETV